MAMRARPLALAVFGILVAGLAPASAAGPQMAIDWNEALFEAFRASAIDPPNASRQLAILNLAMFDAVNAIERRYERYVLTDGPPEGAMPEAAVAAAGHGVLTALYPGDSARQEALLAAHLAGMPAGGPRDAGVGWGHHCAAAMLAAREGDGATAPLHWASPLGTGWWLPTPPGFFDALMPAWPYVTPWAMTSASQFRPPGPPTINDREYLRAFRQVKALGGTVSAWRDAEQSEIARFWEDAPGTYSAPGHWQMVAHVLAQEQGLPLLETARLFALLAIAQADAAILAWDGKYHYNHWRPETAIAGAEVDGNPATVGEPGWAPWIVDPPFPAYPSGHSTFSGASSRVLARVLGRDAVPFTVGSDDLPHATRSFDSLSQAAEENGLSRIFGGVHWAYDNRDGLAAGRALGDYVVLNLLRPLDDPGGRCAPAAHRLCLHGGRFAVEVDWRGRDGSGAVALVGDGSALPLTDSAGGFWFFSPDNVEMLVKVLDACGQDGRFWVFAAAATDLEYVLRVTDTAARRTRTYYNPLGRPSRAVTDTAAFATCP
ncbi:MAG TPA: vanadium-dependent haloperoxidase [Thermoanaerobaculia bacterium]|nr:vanadium-dependent haloperoxidase [Thermoanaerobaculia bacterium]